MCAAINIALFRCECVVCAVLLETSVEGSATLCQAQKRRRVPNSGDAISQMTGSDEALARPRLTFLFGRICQELRPEAAYFRMRMDQSRLVE